MYIVSHVCDIAQRTVLKFNWIQRFLTVGIVAFCSVLSYSVVHSAEAEHAEVPRRDGSMDSKELIVGFREDVDRGTKDALHHRVGGKRIREFVMISADMVVITSRLSVVEAIAMYEADEHVQYAERNQPVHLFDE